MTVTHSVQTKLVLVVQSSFFRLNFEFVIKIGRTLYMRTYKEVLHLSLDIAELSSNGYVHVGRSSGHPPQHDPSKELTQSQVQLQHVQ